MYAIKIYKDENRLIGPFNTYSDARSYLEHILFSPNSDIILMMVPIEACLSIAKERALKAQKQPPPADRD